MICNGLTQNKKENLGEEVRAMGEDGVSEEKYKFCEQRKYNHVCMPILLILLWS